MKQTPDEARATQRMAAGVLCREGFLGEDSRSLAEILDADQSAVAAAGVTHEQIAERLQDLLDDAVEGLGTPVEVAEHITAVFLEAMGRIPCPFGDGIFPKGEVEVTDRRTGKSFSFTPLSVHLIRRHGFYQGRGSRYRMEPGELASVLDLP